MPSSSGQGVSQSLEDAEALSILLAHNLDRNTGKPPTNDALSKTFKQYMSIRKAHVEKILDAGNRAGDTSREMGTVGEMTMYGAMWLICKFRRWEDFLVLRLIFMTSQAVWCLLDEGAQELRRSC